MVGEVGGGFGPAKVPPLFCGECFDGGLPLGAAVYGVEKVLVCCPVACCLVYRDVGLCFSEVAWDLFDVVPPNAVSVLSQFVCEIALMSFQRIVLLIRIADIRVYVDVDEMREL